MRKSLILVALIIIAFFNYLSAQSIDIYGRHNVTHYLLYNIPYPNDACDSVITRDEKGAVSARRTFNLNNNGYVNVSRNFTSFQNSVNSYQRGLNNNTEKISITSSNGNSQNTVSYTGNLVEMEHIQNVMGSTFTDVMKFAYKYDQEGKMIRKAEVRPLNNKWTDVQYFEFNYDKQNRLIHTLHFLRQPDSSYKQANKFEYNYDSKGNLINLYRYTNTEINPSWGISSKDTFIYNSINERVSRTSFWIRENKWEPIVLDSGSNFTTGMKYYRWEKGAWVFKTIEKCESFLQAPPSPPIALNITPKPKTKLVLNWTDKSDDELGFRIYRSTDNRNWTKIDSVNANIISYTDSLLSYNTKYFYKVSAYNNIGELFSDVASNSTLVGIKDNNQGINVSVFPNPVNKQFTINAVLTKAGDLTLILTDVAGRILYKQNEQGFIGTNNITVNLPELNNGIYFLRLNCNNYKYSQKIIIRH